MRENHGTYVGSGVDKLGRTIDVLWELNAYEDDGDPTFIYDRATAWHEDTCLGYLRVEYVDVDRYAELYPTLWNHMSAFSESGYGYARPGVDPRSLCGLAARDFRILTLRDLGVNVTEDPGSYDAFELLAKETDLYAEHTREQQAFITHHMNRPQVGYVDVGEFPDPELFVTDSRNLGIGKILYCGTAIALRAHGLSLHASTLQSVPAQRMWTCMQKAGWVDLIDDPRLGMRMRMIADAIPTSVFSPLSDLDPAGFEP